MLKIKHFIYTLSTCLFLFGGIQVAQASSPRVETILQNLTLDEKIALIGGGRDGFSTNEIRRLNIPSINMTDGPIGVRGGGGTAYPASIAWAATFNKELAKQAANSLGIEARAQNKQMVLGPCVDIARVAIAGRQFEGFGEDPFLASEFSREYVTGMQEAGVMATVKHFIAYNQEYQRNHTDVRVDDRTLHEIYLAPFRAAVEAGVASVMSSYNKVDGLYTSESQRLLTDILKDQLHFQGFVVSDWFAIHDGVLAAKAGLDLEMPHSMYFDGPLRVALASGEITEELINDKVRRLLSTYERFGFLNGPVDTTMPSERNFGRSVGRNIAEESIVLLKNKKSILPLQPEKLNSVALIGASGWYARPGGGGSSRVHVGHLPSAIATTETLLKGMKPTLTVNKAKGPSLTGDHPHAPDNMTWRASYYDNTNLSGLPKLERFEDLIRHDWDWTSVDAGANLPDEGFSASYVSQFIPEQPGPHTIQLSYDDGARFYVNGELVFENWKNVGFKEAQIQYEFLAGQDYELRIEYVDREGLATIYFGIEPTRDPIADAVAAATQSEVAVMFLGLSHKVETENFDRPNLFLPANQIELLEAVLAVNPNTVVVMQAGSPIDMSAWVDRVAAIVYAWYPGQDGDAVIADILTGRVNPSGRLPITLPKRWEDTSVAPTYPDDGNGITEYKDGLFVGYRHFDRNRIEPLYEFGAGLSYTKFGYTDMRIDTVNNSTQNPIVKVSAKITNLGGRAGKETVQLYVVDLLPKREKAVRELKAFDKVELAAGETKTVEFNLGFNSFATYDVIENRWVVDASRYAIQIGHSSRDLRLHQVIQLDPTTKVSIED